MDSWPRVVFVIIGLAAETQIYIMTVLVTRMVI